MVYRTLSSPVNDLSSKSNYAIDLGLSVKWANMNIGAEAPIDYGGEYILGRSGWNNFKDDDSFAGTEKDVAHKMWGDGWRMPSRTEWEELIRDCVWSRVSFQGTRGYVVIGKNGNAIFIPATADADDLPFRCTYWTSTVGKYTVKKKEYVSIGTIQLHELGYP